MPQIQRTIIVEASVDRVYRWWAQWENLAGIFPHLREIKRTGPLQTRWRVESDEGGTLEWDAVTLHDLPQRQLVWESRGPSPRRMQVAFEALSHHRTRLSVSYRGAEGEESDSDWFVRDLDTALERFRQTVEKGTSKVPFAAASPHRALFYKAMAASAGVLLMAGIAWSAVALMEVWMIMLAALLLSATLSPAVSWLAGRKVPRALAVAITFTALLATITVLVVILIPGIISQVQDLAARLPAYASQIQGLLAEWHGKHRFIPEGTQLMAYLAEQGSLMLGNAFSLTTRVLWLTVVLLSVLFIALFLLLDGGRLQQTFLRLMPTPQKSQVPALLHTVQERVGSYMLGLAFISALAGLLTWGALALMGIPYALLVGAVTTLLQAIPFVGPMVAGGLAAAVALSKSPESALWTLLVYGGIQQIIGQILFPLVVGRTVGMHPVWIVLALLVGGALYGLVGAFLAIPVAIAVSIVLECYYFPWAEAKAAEGEAP